MKLLATLALLSIAQAQPAFEVASVKPELTGGVSGGCHGIDSKFPPGEAEAAPPLGRCVIKSGRLGHMLRAAYNLRAMNAIKSTPDWVLLGDDRFTVEAKAEDPSRTTEQQLLQMLQALLIERFNIRLHWETKEVSGFALVVAKNGPKFKQATKPEESTDWGPSFKPGRGPNTLTARSLSMAKLADILNALGSPVIDKTGLTGAYDFTLSWDDTNGPQLSTALQQQLGLKFESEKVPFSVLVVDSAQKPGAN